MVNAFVKLGSMDTFFDFLVMLLAPIGYFFVYIGYKSNVGNLFFVKRWTKEEKYGKIMIIHLVFGNSF